MKSGRTILGTLVGNRRLVLASKSPRRAELLKKAGIDFQIEIPEVDEREISEDPREHVLRLSKMKAQSVLPKVKEGLILGADTIVVSNGEILGKPRSREEAVLMLRKLSDKEHEVYTGLTLIEAGTGSAVSGYQCTKVKFKSLSDEEIALYISTGESEDKAGAYGIQGKGGSLVKRIDGPLDNVIGLPRRKLKEMLIQISREKDG